MNDFYPEPPRPELSFEFFPPRSAIGTERLVDVYKTLSQFAPQFVSVTYGAMGSTQKGTMEAVKQLQSSGAQVVPHVTGIGSQKVDICKLVDSYLALDIDRFVVLRGDLPKDHIDRGEFPYAENLLHFIRSEFGGDLHLEVAAYPELHPESTDPSSELKYFKAKFDAGASSAITQYFYNVDSYFAFVREAERVGIDAPIVPGIMPIVNYETLVRFSKACGAEIPRWIISRLEQYQNDEASLKAFGLDVVTQLCWDLLDRGVPGLHFYTLNKTQPVAEICQRLGFDQHQIPQIPQIPQRQRA